MERVLEVSFQRFQERIYDVHASIAMPLLK